MQPTPQVLPAEIKLALQKAQSLSNELKARRAVRDPYFWLTECTRTVDEQSEIAFKPFPREPYIKHLLDALENETVLLIEKSRSVMGSWTVAGWCAHYGFNNKAKKILFAGDFYRVERFKGFPEDIQLLVPAVHIKSV